MPVYHEVQQGECLVSIAKRYGFARYETIYEHPENAELKKKRPNPNIIYPGDQIYIPDVVLKEVTLPTGQRHQFQRKRLTRTLRIALEDQNGKCLAGAKYELTFGTRVVKGATDADGMLEQEVFVGEERGKLSVNGYSWNLLVAHLNPLDANTEDGGITGTQGRLLNLGYYVGPIDGELSPTTKAALRQFQSEAGLRVTGDLDGPTRAKLRDKHGC